MEKEKIAKILENHSHWKRQDCEGWENMRATFVGVNLRGVDLGGADLRCADLSDANLRGAKYIPFIPMACPDKGEFIGFKKASQKIVELKIMERSKRCSATRRKCRCDQAKVLSITNLDGTKSNLAEVQSDNDATFVYRIGEVVSVKDFCDDRWNECSAGIHFFITRQEAVEY